MKLKTELKLKLKSRLKPYIRIHIKMHTRIKLIMLGMMQCVVDRNLLDHGGHATSMPRFSAKTHD